MMKPLQATPVVHGEDAKRVSAPLRSEAPVDRKLVEQRQEAIKAMRQRFVMSGLVRRTP